MKKLNFPCTLKKLSIVTSMVAMLSANSWAVDNDYFEEMSKNNQGFAGYFYNEDGQLVVKMKPVVSKKGETFSAKAAISSLKTLNTSDVHLQKSADIIVETAKYSFSELNSVYKKYAADVLDIEGVTFTDIDERQNQIVIGTDSENSEAEVKAQLDELFIQYDDLISFERSEVSLRNLRANQSQKRAGHQIGFNGAGGGFVCTLGMTANINGVRGIITASHCDATGTIGVNETTGTNYGQPSASSTIIATESIDPVASPRRSDALFAPYSTGVNAPVGQIARTVGGPNGGSLQANGRFLRVTGKADAVVGQTVHKVGRTTGWTSGRVTRTCFNANFGPSVGTTSCQTVSSIRSDRGDSGSGMFIRRGRRNATFVGILSGGINATGETIFSPTSSIEAELGTIRF